MATGYQYSALDISRKEIRILWVKTQSLSDTSPLKCQLQHVGLDDDVLHYEVVSYTWEDPSRRKSMMVDDVLVSVPESADTALRHLYRATRMKTRLKLLYWRQRGLTGKFRVWYWRQQGLTGKVPVWIDSICIDQSNLQERNQQVKLMGEIYSKAVGVNAWLGRDDTGTAVRAKKAMRKLCSHLVAGRGVFAPSRHFESGFARPTLTRADWESIASFYSSKWFTRTWIVQEALLNKSCRVYKGMVFMDMIWVLLTPFSALIGLNYPTEIQNFSINARAGWDNALTMLILNDDAPAKGGSVRLSKIILHTSKFEATEVLDKVYGFLGLVDAETLEDIDVDYSRRVVDVFTSASRLAIQNAESLGMLFGAYSRSVPAIDPVQEAFPSWVVHCNWERQAWPRGIIGNPGLLMETSKFFGLDRVEDDSVLKVRGLMLGEIATDLIVLITVINDEMQWYSRKYVKKFLRSFGKVRSLARQTLPDVDDDELAYELAKILTNGDAYELGSQETPLTRLADLFEALMSLLQSAEMRFGVHDKYSGLEQTAPALEVVVTRSGGRGFFAMSDGRLGTAWPTA